MSHTVVIEDITFAISKLDNGFWDISEIMYRYADKWEEIKRSKKTLTLIEDEDTLQVKYDCLYYILTAFGVPSDEDGIPVILDNVDNNCICLYKLYSGDRSPKGIYCIADSYPFRCPDGFELFRKKSINSDSDAFDTLSKALKSYQRENGYYHVPPNKIDLIWSLVDGHDCAVAGY